MLCCVILYQSLYYGYVNDKVMGYDFILGAVYVPHEMYVHYHDDIFDQV